MACASFAFTAINAGVVGYSSLQELRFLKKFIIPLEPDDALLACTTRLDRKTWLGAPVPAEPATIAE